MEHSPLELEGISGLDELIEKHLRAIFDKLATPHTLYEIESELAKLNALIDSFKRRDELLEKLIDSSTPEEKRRQICERLEELSIKMATNESGVEQLHARSHQFLERSMLLRLEAQKRIYGEAYSNSDYRVETCLNCQGLRRYEKERCMVCEGTGVMLVPKSPDNSSR